MNDIRPLRDRVVLISLSAPIPWAQVIKRTASEFNNDNCFGLAAQLSFYFLLSLFPTLLFLVVLLGYVPLETTFGQLAGALRAVAPRELVVLLRDQLMHIAGGGPVGLLTLGVGAALWRSSAAMVATIDALNRAFDVTEWRPWWKRRLLAVGLTVALSLSLVVALGLILIGPSIAFRIAEWLRVASLLALIWTIVRWPLMIACVVLGVDLVYHFAPNRRARWIWFTPGSIVAMALWLGSSFAFKLYVASFADYAATYGAIGGAIVTMLWFYTSSIAILIGAELNGVIEHAWRAVGGKAAEGLSERQ